MKKILFTLGAICSTLTVFAQDPISIATARATALGQTVTVRGVVTNGNEFGAIRYLQDGTAGIAAYGGSVSGIALGDSITVTGPLTEFNGLLEIGTGQAGGNPTYIDHGAASALVQPQIVPLSAIGESLEGQLVRVDNVTFTTTGNFPSNNNVVITNGANTLQVRINSATNIDATAIPTGTVSIIGVVSQFQNDYQLLPRSLSDIIPYVAPDREINVLINGQNYLTGSTVYMGTATSTPLTVENLGVGNLTISSSTFTGAQASAFSVNIPTGNLNPNSTNNYTVNLVHQGPGTHAATLTIASNDDDEPNYVLYFEAGGSDNLATAPSANPTNLVVTTNKAYKIDATFTAAAGNPKYLVLWSNGAAVSATPTAGTTYQRGDQVGNAKVTYVGTATGFSPRGVIANQTYHYAIYAYNGTNGVENYNLTNPLVGQITSGGAEIGTYYNTVSSNATTFPSDLKSIIDDHTVITYYNYLQTFLNAFSVNDTADNKSYVECRYSGYKVVYEGSFGWNNQDFSREHVFAHSWMPGPGYNSPEQAPYTDQHNLFPVKMNDVNGARSNYPFGEVVTPNHTFMDTKRGINANNQMVYEPKDDVKGDIARALMYMAVRYNGLNGSWGMPNYISFGIPYGQDIETLLNWHYADLPDAYEIARNEYVFSVQGNRNPFIDSVDYACKINFTNVSHQPNGCQLGLNNSISTSDVTVFPVPASTNLEVAVNSAMITGYEIVDLTGRTVKNETAAFGTSATIDVTTLNTGAYLLRISTERGAVTQKITIK